jgi:hypothetical protein
MISRSAAATFAISALAADLAESAAAKLPTFVVIVEAAGAAAVLDVISDAATGTVGIV